MQLIKIKSKIYRHVDYIHLYKHENYVIKHKKMYIHIGQYNIKGRKQERKDKRRKNEGWRDKKNVLARELTQDKKSNSVKKLTNLSLIWKLLSCFIYVGSQFYI